MVALRTLRGPRITRGGAALLFITLIVLVPRVAGAAPVDLDLPFRLNGFVEEAVSIRTQNDPQQPRDFPLGELRLQLEAFRAFDAGEFKFRGDFLHDQAQGEFEFDLREAYLFLFPADILDVKVGRQILTWGTGDLIFLNDLFPKDFQSFFIGRDDVYLKAPSDAARFSLYPGGFNIDFVWTPGYDSDRFITGERLSFFDENAGRKAGQNNQLNFIHPEQWVKDSELALRLFQTIEGYELALYGYYGFWKNPAGADAEGKAILPRLAVVGASVRGPVLDGIGNLEVAFYNSLEDTAGTVPTVKNSEFRFLAGYKRELVADVTLGLQYNLERMIDHADFIRSLPAGGFPKDENRHVTTVRLTWLLLQQTVEVSMFTFYSPSDGDAHLRPKVLYKVTDAWHVTLGANVFAGASEKTFFGMLQDNTNLYARVRYSF